MESKREALGLPAADLFAILAVGALAEWGNASSSAARPRSASTPHEREHPYARYDTAQLEEVVRDLVG